MSRLLHGLALIVCALVSVKAHPQCLDFRAPFEPATPLSFCSEYANYACCDSENDNKLREEYEYIQRKSKSGHWGRCQGYLKQILCQRCSPYAAHIYDAETSGTPRKFPGLCTGYCHEFYDTCKSFLWLLDPQLAGSNVLSSKDGFCNSVSLSDADYCYPDLKTNPVLQGDLSARTSQEDGCLCLEKINSRCSLSMPLAAVHANDGSGRLFVMEQIGRVRIYNTRTRRWNFGCFLDLSLKVAVTPVPADERGALSIAFHPDFANNGRFFVYYTATRWFFEPLPPELEGRPFFFNDKVIVSEMRVSKISRDIADPFYEKVLLSLPQPFINHNGGTLLFGEDGYLYVFVGDGGGAGDAMKSAQNKTLLHGKVLRLDVDSDRSQAYTIPPDNPFVGEAGTKPEIYALGMRNPWRCAMDRGERGTGNNAGRMLCGDVGQFRAEEIDLIKKGVNYGWNSREGFDCYDQELCGNIGPEELPIMAYNHTVGKSVTGGVFYRGCESPSLDGQYIYGDYISKRLFSLNETGGDWTNREVSLCGDMCQGGLQGTLDENIVSFGEDQDGEIYVMTTGSSSSLLFDGSIFKIVDPASRNDPSTCQSDLTRDDRVPLPKRSFLWEAGKRRQKPVIKIRVTRRRKYGADRSQYNKQSSAASRNVSQRKAVLSRRRPWLRRQRTTPRKRTERLGRRSTETQSSPASRSRRRSGPPQTSRERGERKRKRGKGARKQRRKRRRWGKRKVRRRGRRPRVKDDAKCLKVKYKDTFKVVPKGDERCDVCRAAFLYGRNRDEL